MRGNRKSSAMMCALSVLALSSASAAVAQDTQGQADSDADVAAGGGLEDIVVTAQKRSERLQEVPLAISAFSAASLAAANVENATDIAKITPSLSMTQASGVVVPFLRGIGSSSVGQGIESNTAIYIDGIYYPRLAPLYFQLNNIERVEVLKGPQGTLFGRNAVGGVVHIITSDPGPQTKLHAAVGYGNFDTISANFYAGGELTEGVGLDLALLYSHQGNGWGRNVTTGSEFGYSRDFSARSKLVLQPTDTTTVKLVGDYARQRSTIGLPGNGYRGTTQGNLLPPFEEYRPEDIGFYNVRGDFDGLIGGSSWGISGRVDQELGFATFVSLTAYREANDIFKFDNDFTPQPAFVITLPTERSQFSQEFQLVSTPDSPFDWILGLYHLDLDTRHVDASFSGLALGGAQRLVIGRLETTSNAAFGQATFHLGSATNFTAGLRFTRDNVRNSGRQDTVLPDGTFVRGVDVDQGEIFKKLTYKAVLDHRFTRDVMAYASYSRGFRSGTYRISPVVAGPPARAEVLDAYEIGIKSELFDRRLRLNGALFYYDIKDPQVSRYPGGGATVLYINAGSAEVKGFEIDGQAKLSDRLSAQFGLTVLRAKFTDFTGAPFIAPNPNPPFGNGPTTPGDATGNDLMRTPRLTLNVGLVYDLPTAIGDWQFSANYYYNDGFFWDPDNRLKQRPYHLVDAGIAYRLPDNPSWRVRLWGKNLLNEKYYLQENQIAGANGSASAPAAPRTYGISLSYDM